MPPVPQTTARARQGSTVPPARSTSRVKARSLGRTSTTRAWSTICTGAARTRASRIFMIAGPI
jgi:hypothetical protein